MPSKSASAQNKISHIYNRGIEKRKIFEEESDYFRFIYGLYEFNNEAAAQNIYYKKTSLKSYEVQPQTEVIHRRKKLVEIIAFCLMPNHFHLMLKESAENGITKFMRKLGTGYTMYFNQKNKREGSLFQGGFKIMEITGDSHLLYLPHYINLNPLDLSHPSWREGKLLDSKNALRFLESYRWSSYLDHIGKKNFPAVISQNSFKNLYGTPLEYKVSVSEWLSEIENNKLDPNIILE